MPAKIKDNFNDDNFVSENIIAGRNPVIEALKSDSDIDAVYISGGGGSLNLIRKLAKDKGIVVKDVQDSKLTQMCSGASHQGVAAPLHI